MAKCFSTAGDYACHYCIIGQRKEAKEQKQETKLEFAIYE